MEAHLRLRSGNDFLTNRLWRPRIDSHKVMADQSVHDVVIQPQSVDALRSTDVSGTNETDIAARAAADNPATFNGSDINQQNLPQQVDNDNGDASQEQRVHATHVKSMMRSDPDIAQVRFPRAWQ